MQYDMLMVWMFVFFQNLYVELTFQLMQSELKPVRWDWARMDCSPYEGILMKALWPFYCVGINQECALSGAIICWPLASSTMKNRFLSFKTYHMYGFLFVIDVQTKTPHVFVLCACVYMYINIHTCSYEYT